VSFWRRLFRGEPPAAEPAAPAASAPAPMPAKPVRDPDLESLRMLAEGTDVSLADLAGALERCRGTATERAALEAVVEARSRGRAPEPLLIAAAGLALDRGDPERALLLLEGLRSSTALLLAADVLADRGEVARALTLAERVLAREIDAPGARERHGRWRSQLGGIAPAAPALDAPTLLRAEAPETSLRIVGEAGRGGAGTVYEAVDDLLGRRVALKVYHRPGDERDKLEREARYAVRLAGQGVVRVFDADPARGLIVMEWAPGGALKRWIVRADTAMLWPLERWLVPLARVLDRIHAAGVVHGDLKPANVLFRAPDDPILSDFGLAHESGELVTGGSLGYLSPERLLGQPLTPPDDIYALGRVVEDALEAIERAPEPPEPAALALWRGRVEQALGPVADRPPAALDLADFRPA
jgi:eukaryotic-like serine/threonine-protein kinase